MSIAQRCRRKAALFLQLANERDGREAELLVMLAAENLQRAERAEREERDKLERGSPPKGGDDKPAQAGG